MLNTLANHGILPHSGYNFTLNATVQGLIDGVNFTPELGTFLFDFAILTNPNPNATSFSLHQLGTHGILEHDASLRWVNSSYCVECKADKGNFSRIDKYFNDTDAFNQQVFDETTSYWKGDVIDLHTAATSRRARAKTSVATDPAFTFSDLAFGFAHGEVAALPLVFGDRVAGTAPKNIVTSFFGNDEFVPLLDEFDSYGYWLTRLLIETEHLPTALGWKKPAVPIGNLDLCKMSQRVISASGTTLEKAEELLPCSAFDA